MRIFLGKCEITDTMIKSIPTRRTTVVSHAHVWKLEIVRKWLTSKLLAANNASQKDVNGRISINIPFSTLTKGKALVLVIELTKVRINQYLPSPGMNLKGLHDDWLWALSNGTTMSVCKVRNISEQRSLAVSDCEVAVWIGNDKAVSSPPPPSNNHELDPRTRDQSSQKTRERQGHRPARIQVKALLIFVIFVSVNPWGTVEGCHTAAGPVFVPTFQPTFNFYYA